MSVTMTTPDPILKPLERFLDANLYRVFASFENGATIKDEHGVEWGVDYDEGNGTLELTHDEEGVRATETYVLDTTIRKAK